MLVTFLHVIFTFQIVYLSLNVIEIIYFNILLVYSIMLQINKPVQNTAHVYYFNIVNARSTAKLSIASENSHKKFWKCKIIFLIRVSIFLVYEFMSAEKYLLTYKMGVLPSSSGKC
jgi:hypothetical protein